MNLLVDGNAPAVDLSETPIAGISAKLTITAIPTQSSIVVSPTPNVKVNPWTMGSITLWLIVILILIIGITYWIKVIKTTK